MQAKDIMTTHVISVKPNNTVKEIASLMIEKGISAVPVVNDGKIVGMVSEGDLIHRQELGDNGYRRRGSWYKLIEDETAAKAFIAKTHGMHACDVMTPNIISVSRFSSLPEVADIMESNNVKRVVVITESQLEGIIARADIVRALAARPEGAEAPKPDDDDEIRIKVIEALEAIPGTSNWLTTVVVENGIVTLYGTVEDEKACCPSRAAVEKIPHVVSVNDKRNLLQPY